MFDKLGKAFSDFDYGAFARYLHNSGLSGLKDGTTSQLPIAGTVTTPQAAAILFPGATTVADAFRLNSGLNAVTSVLSSTLTTFFRPGALSTSNNGVNGRNQSLILHEALHGFGGSLGGTSYFDDQLQKAFGIPVQADSSNITTYIKDNCF